MPVKEPENPTNPAHEKVAKGRKFCGDHLMNLRETASSLLPAAVLSLPESAAFGRRIREFLAGTLSKSWQSRSKNLAGRRSTASPFLRLEEMRTLRRQKESRREEKRQRTARAPKRWRVLGSAC